MANNVAEKQNPCRQPSNHSNMERTSKKDAIFIPEFLDEAYKEIVY
jgi:hypothetical protein